MKFFQIAHSLILPRPTKKMLHTSTSTGAIFVRKPNTVTFKVEYCLKSKLVRNVEILFLIIPIMLSSNIQL